MKRTEMRDKEIKRLKVLSRLREGLWSERTAAERLNVSTRQVRRLQRFYETEGAAGIVSKRRGKPSSRRIEEAVQAEVLRQVQTRYADFGPTLAAEYLIAEGTSVSKETRLVKALRLAGIKDMAAGNAFLPAYMESHNARFAEPPQDSDDTHQTYRGTAIELRRICAIHQTRKLSKDLVISYHRQRYITRTEGQPRYALRGVEITVVNYPDSRIERLHGDEMRPFRVLDPAQSPQTPVDEKTLNVRVDEALTARRWSEKSRPAPTHPWRRPIKSPSSVAGQLSGN